MFTNPQSSTTEKDEKANQNNGLVRTQYGLVPQTNHVNSINRHRSFIPSHLLCNQWYFSHSSRVEKKKKSANSLNMKNMRNIFEVTQVSTKLV